MPVWARNDSCLFRKQPCGQHAATQGSQFAVHLQDVVNVTPSWLVITCSPSAVFLLAIPPSHTVSPAVPFEGFPEKRQKAPAHETQWKRQGGSLEILQSLNPFFDYTWMLPSWARRSPVISAGQWRKNQQAPTGKKERRDSGQHFLVFLVADL